MKLKALTNVNMFALLVINILKKNNTPPQAVSNKLMLDPIPDILDCLNRLERYLNLKKNSFQKNNHYAERSTTKN